MADLIRADLGLTGRLGTVVDVGCGAGLSTAPLIGWADRTVGLDPSPAMVSVARRAVGGAHFLVAAAERLPFPDRSVDLITAAGALDFADYERFAAEAARVLTLHGSVAVYDFAAGRRLARPAPEGAALERWHDEFRQRWATPRPAADLLPVLEAGRRLALTEHRPVVVSVPLTRAAYLDYVMSDAPDPDDEELAAWCRDSLPAVFGAQEVVEFDAYVAYLRER